MPIYIPESDEIDWEMFIQDENDRELTREVYENIGKIDEYRANHPDIPEKIYKKVQLISKYGVEIKYHNYNSPNLLFIGEQLEIPWQQIVDIWVCHFAVVQSIQLGLSPLSLKL